MYELSQRTKENIEKTVGLSYSEIVNMDFEEIDKHIAAKKGLTKIPFASAPSIRIGPPMEEVEKRIGKI